MANMPSPHVENAIQESQRSITSTLPPNPLTKGERPDAEFSLNSEAPKPKTTPAKTPQPTEQFHEFWEAYPRHEAMLPAWRAWQKIKQPVPLEKIMTAVKIHKRKRWNGAEKNHIPLAATWLNGERWDDEM